MARGPTGMLLLAWAATASAVPLFADDFESGNILTTDVPPGRWDDVIWVLPSDAGVIASAAHRGAGGLRYVDNRSITGAGPGTTVEKDFGAPAGGDFYARAWIRVNYLDGGS